MSSFANPVYFSDIVFDTTTDITNLTQQLFPNYRAHGTDTKSYRVPTIRTPHEARMESPPNFNTPRSARGIFDK